MTTLATIIAAYAALVLVLPGFGPPFVADRRATVPFALSAHLSGGLVALMLGAWQFNTRIRNGFRDVHRWMGRGYLVAVIIGSLGGFMLATRSLHGLPTHVGFGLLAILWCFTAVMAYAKVRRGDITAHRRWMIRSYALTLAAVTLRIYLPASEIAGLPFAESYQVTSWLCWVPNLIAAEWWFVPRTDIAAVGLTLP